MLSTDRQTATLWLVCSSVGASELCGGRCFLTGINQLPDNCYSIVRDELTHSEGTIFGRTSLIIAVSPHLGPD